MASLKDIAQVCGVSVATVSKALNNHSDVSEARREQIKSKARELGYFPNQAARALKTRSTMDIGVLFADAHNSGLTHPYFSQVLEGLKIRTEERGYDLTFIGIKSKRNKMTFLEHCVYRNVDGVVVACVDFNQPEVLELVRSRLPVVTIDHVMDDCATISSNNVEGMTRLTQHVLSKGHRKVAYIHGRPSSTTSERMVGFFRAMEEKGIDPRKPTSERFLTSTMRLLTTRRWNSSHLRTGRPASCIPTITVVSAESMRFGIWDFRSRRMCRSQDMTEYRLPEW